MSARFFDDKGKYFTDVVPKTSVNVLIQSQTDQIIGEIYVRQDERLIDAINSADQFLVVTNAIIRNSAGQELIRTRFLTVNKERILWLIPSEEVENARDQKTISGGGEL